MDMGKVAKKNEKINTVASLLAEIPHDIIHIKGARVNNLQNIEVKIPKNKLVVVTGVSGSGKTSLVMDTLFAEGQRKYVESLSSYARQFLLRMDKPNVDFIKGICPAIAIGQSVSSKNVRSTVGTMTEIYDYLKLLYARVGKTYSPISGKEVKKHDVSDVVDYIYKQKNGTKAFILLPLSGTAIKKHLETLKLKGYSRLFIDDELVRIDEVLKNKKISLPKSAYLLIDRVIVNQDDIEEQQRIADSINTAFFESLGDCLVKIEHEKIKTFSNRFELDGLSFEEPNTNFFSFNNPYGACKTCEGFGHILGIDKDLVFPNKKLSVYEDAVACWRGEKMKKWKDKFIAVAANFDFPIHRPYNELTTKEKDLLWTGNEHFKGINQFFKYVESKSYKIQFRVMLSRYRGRQECPDCKGTRIRQDTNNVRVQDKTIIDLLLMPVGDLEHFINNLKLDKQAEQIAKRLLTEIKERLSYLMNVGLEYLTLNRTAGTLSGGESQRIHLTRTLGSNLTSSLYILDEPSIGLHPRDTGRLIEVLKHLRDLGNTVIVVEHEEAIMKAADEIIDIGPLAGRIGGQLIAQGTAAELAKNEKSLTGKYLTKQLKVERFGNVRKWHHAIEVLGARQHNLQNINVKIPLNILTVITGVSGSGKTTLVKDIFYPAVKRILEDEGNRPGEHDSIKGNLELIKQIELLDQRPLGRSSRSNPVTYVKAYDAIRELFSKQQLSKIKGFKPKHFSFNVEGGRCETCKGEGEVLIEMQFLADVRLQCEECKGKRFIEDVLEVKYKGKNISDVLDMTIEDAIEFFADNKDVMSKMKALHDIGLGYLTLGQSSSTLSGGEAQRVKLASYLNRGKALQPILFIFDEPTTGLHFHDIQFLLKAFNALIDNGHTVVVIEHNMDVIKCADWLIDLGPEGGDKGGRVLFEGLPNDLIDCKASFTGQYLKS